MDLVYNKFVSLGLQDIFPQLFNILSFPKKYNATVVQTVVDITFWKDNIESIWDYILNYYNLLQLEDEYNFLLSNLNNQLSYDCGVSHSIEDETTWKSYILQQVQTLIESNLRTIKIAEKKVEYISSKYKRTMRKIGCNVNYRTKATEYSSFRRFCH